MPGTEWEPPVSPASPATEHTRHGEAATAAPPNSQHGGWRPPSKPGLLPLRPIGFGSLLIAPFRVLRHNPAATFGSALIVQVIVAVATTAAIIPVTISLISRIDGVSVNATQSEIDAVIAGSIAQVLLVLLIPLVLSVVASAFLQGLLIAEVASGMLGDKLSMGALWRRAGRRLAPLIGWVFVSAFAVLIAFALIIGASIALGFALPVPLGPILAVALGLAALFALVVLLAWVGTKLAVVPSVIMLERRGVLAAIRRSWGLTRGYFWRTLGVLVIVSFAIGLATQIVTQPISIVASLAGGTFDTVAGPGSSGASDAVFIALSIVSVIVTVLAGAIAAVLQSALVGFIYIDLRMRTEGLDLELARFVEQRGAGVATDDDPYRVRAADSADSTTS